MSLFKDTFKRTTASKANDKKALEILNKRKNKQAPVATVVAATAAAVNANLVFFLIFLVIILNLL